MSDILFVGIFLACCAATVGLVLLCDRLMRGGEETGSKP
jgi:hypothetical protein